MSPPDHSGSDQQNGSGRQPLRALQVPAPVVHELPLPDGVGIRLTRYQGGDKGPVLLVHCIGVSSRMFSLDSIPTNLLEYLVAAGFDVWLLDYRYSIDLPSARLPASFDTVARLDYPAAVAAVLQLSGKTSLQVVAHGIGSQTFNMAMLGGMQGVRAAVCSQVAVHLHAPRLSRIKSLLPLPAILQGLGLDALTASAAGRGLGGRLLDASLLLHPIRPGQHCNSATCRRITGFYGALYRHEQLNPPTHAALDQLFGPFNLKAFGHLVRNLRAGHLVSDSGADIYRPALQRLAIPICFVHGLDNDCLLPESTRETHAVLSQTNGADLYGWQGIAGYGHVDCMIGYQAVRDVYPGILAHLEATA